jgi:hypothetical protein
LEEVALEQGEVAQARRSDASWEKRPSRETWRSPVILATGRQELGMAGDSESSFWLGKPGLVAAFRSAQVSIDDRSLKANVSRRKNETEVCQIVKIFRQNEIISLRKKLNYMTQ